MVVLQLPKVKKGAEHHPAALNVILCPLVNDH
jgi:hypothetical protein